MKILSLQDEQGSWGNPRRLWGYKNSVFQLLLLSELGFERDPRIEKALEFVFSFQLEDGSFSSAASRKKKEWLTDEFCLTGIIMKFLLLFGYEADSRLHKALDFLIGAGEDWSCAWYPLEKDKVIPTACYMGGIKALSALAKLPSTLVTRQVREVIERNAELYLENRIYWYRRDAQGERTKKPSWTRFAFPLFWQSDVLDVLDVLTELGVRDERMDESVTLVRSKQAEGRWILERTYPKKFELLGERGKPSKWITLRALRVLKRLGEVDHLNVTFSGESNPESEKREKSSQRG
ncbi:MAG: hypothetical protein HXS43_08320 [Theionarchaea archaeon]|nr:hypothetical protein [Theionarchaea archaeon]